MNIICILYIISCITEQSSAYQFQAYGTTHIYTRPQYIVASYGKYYAEIPIDYNDPNGFISSR